MFQSYRPDVSDHQAGRGGRPRAGSGRPWSACRPGRSRRGGSWQPQQGFAGITGDATRREILRRAEISKAQAVIITLDRDDSAILVTLTVRQLNPGAHIVVAVRERDNASLLRQFDDPTVATLQTGDRVVVVRRAPRATADRTAG